jgi:hypothetical protein
MKLLASFLTVAALGAPAFAGAALKAHLECTPDGGKPLAARQKVALDKAITCSIVIDAGAVPAGDSKAVIDAKVGTPIGPVKGHPHDAKPADAKHLTADPFKPAADFLNCGGLQIDATISGGDKVVWSASLAVQSACSPAKTVKAAVNCGADAGDKGYVTFPGNGDKIGPTLDAGLTCTITGPDDASAHYGVLQVEGASTPGVIGLLAAQGNAKTPIMYTQFMASQLPKCKPFVVDAAVLDADGGAMWTTKLPIKQSCSKGK